MVHPLDAMLKWIQRHGARTIRCFAIGSRGTAAPGATQNVRLSVKKGIASCGRGGPDCKDEFKPVPGSQFLHEDRHVVLYRFFAQAKIARHFPVGLTLEQEAGDLLFPYIERFCRRSRLARRCGRSQRGNNFGGDVLAYKSFSAKHGLDCVQEFLRGTGGGDIAYSARVERTYRMVDADCGCEDHDLCLRALPRNDGYLIDSTIRSLGVQDDEIGVPPHDHVDRFRSWKAEFKQNKRIIPREDAKETFKHYWLVVYKRDCFACLQVDNSHAPQ
nr:hypothetical protein [Mesorhizobium albiziae]